MSLGNHWSTPTSQTGHDFHRDRNQRRQNFGGWHRNQEGFCRWIVSWPRTCPYRLICQPPVDAQFRAVLNMEPHFDRAAGLLARRRTHCDDAWAPPTTIERGTTSQSHCGNLCARSQLGDVFIETGFELSKDTVRIPDAAFVRAEKMKALDLDQPCIDSPSGCGNRGCIAE